MIRKTAGALSAVVALVCLASAGTPALAQKSAVAYASEKEITLTGTVKAFEYMNPHSALQMMVTEKGGKPAQWTIETESPLILKKAGIERMALEPGDKVTARVHPAIDKPLTAWLIELKKADGTVLTVPEPYQETPPTSSTPKTTPAKPG
jgi:hypothetical protein